MFQDLLLASTLRNSFINLLIFFEGFKFVCQVTGYDTCLPMLDWYPENGLPSVGSCPYRLQIPIDYRLQHFHCKEIKLTGLNNFSFICDQCCLLTLWLHLIKLSQIYCCERKQLFKVPNRKQRMTFLTKVVSYYRPAKDIKAIKCTSHHYA